MIYHYHSHDLFLNNCLRDVEHFLLYYGCCIQHILIVGTKNIQKKINYLIES